MNKLSFYAQFLTPEQISNTDALYGYLLELGIKDYFNKPLKISKVGKIDLSIKVDGRLRRMEVKQNGGDFRYACKGSSMIAYSVYVDINADLAHQFGYVMPMTVFRSCGEELKHIRNEKRDSKGNTKMSLQTLYNYKVNDFHGNKAFKLADMWEENGAISFKEFFK